MSTQKTIGIIIAVAVIVGGAAFWGGMKYQQSKKLAFGMGAAGQFDIGTDRPNGNGAVSRANLSRATNGEVLAKDDSSITIKLSDGGSKIILFSSTTIVNKMAIGSADDIAVGESVTVMGTTNTDGSLTAQNIQIRPTQPQPANATPPPAAVPVQ